MAASDRQIKDVCIRGSVSKGDEGDVMFYSKSVKAVMISVALSACAHGASTQSAEYTDPTTVQTAGSRTTDGPRFTRQQTTFLAGEGRPQVSGGEVIVERLECDVWTDQGNDSCDLSKLANESMTPGYRSW
jgi:hypothetical protein